MKKTFFLLGWCIFSFFEAYPNVKDLYENINHSTTNIVLIETNNVIQDNVITGQVIDETGIPMPGVNVIVNAEGRPAIGVVTDFDGNYRIEVPANAQAIVFSYLGYQEQRVMINGQQVINVTMQPETTALNEVVVTALGITKDAKSLGYAVSKVDGEELSVNRSSNFMNALQGKVAGVNITAASTGAAGTSKVRIRGQSSFGGTNSPLIVINGVPVDNTNYGVLDGNQGQETSPGTGAVADGGDGLSSINPEDIESMTILKGGAASALYGSRAKDGVIMIVTKSRIASGLQVEYNSNVMVGMPLDFTDYQYEYGQGRNGIRPTTPNPDSGVWSFGEKFESGMTQILFDGVEVPYAPVKNRIRKFYDNSIAVTNSISVSTGGEHGGMRISLSNLEDKGIVPGNVFRRQTFDVGFSHSFSNKFSLSGNVNYSHQKTKNAPTVVTQDLSTATTIYSLANSMPLDLLEQYSEDENGNEIFFSQFRNRTNPYFVINNAFNNIERDRFFGNLTARYNINEWLYTQVRGGQDYYNRNQEHNTLPTGVQSLAAADDGFVNGSYRQDNQQFRETNFDFMLGANKEFGDFGVEAFIGGNMMRQRVEVRSDAVQDFKVRGLYTIDNGRISTNNTNGIPPRYDYTERAVNSAYGSAELNYKGLIFLNATLRNDWFSTLSEEERSVIYPSFTGSFIFSDAFEGMPEWINFGKIRAGYSEVGSDTDVGSFANKLFYSTNPNLFNGQTVGNILGARVPNPNLSPMRVEEYEFGIEARMFNNRVGLEVSYYNKLSKDQILQAPISNTSGYTSQLINIGESKNEGVELLLSVTPVRTENFNWNFTFNGSYNTSEVLSLGSAAQDTMRTVALIDGGRLGEVRHVVGQPLGQLYGNGILRDAEGNQVFNEANGYPLATPEKIALGSAIPKWIGGITNTFQYKDISFSFLIDFKLGHKVISTTNFNAYRHGLHKTTLVGREQNEVVGVGVNPDGGVNTTPAPLDAYYSQIRGLDLLEPFTYNAGFWKLRQVTLGFDFTRHLPKDSFITGLKFDLVASNVFMLKKWIDNIDPEQTGYASDNLNGIENPALPTTRNIGFNLNVKF